MPQNDPTDHALAAIASILDHKEAAAAKDTERGSSAGLAATKASDVPAAASADIGESFHFTEPSRDTQTVHVSETVTIVAETTTVVTETHHEVHETIHEHDAPATVPEVSADDAIDIDGYSRGGPGPLDAIRFRWTARRDDNGDYFVDETIGTSSRPIPTGPMPRRDVVAFIDGRERAARERFDDLKSSMTLAHPVGSHDASET